MQSLHTNKNIFQLKYLVLPDYIFRDDRLSSTAIKVYAFINSYTGKLFFFGNEHLAEMFECSESAISRAIAQLKELKYIDTEFDGRRRFIINLKASIGGNAYSESAETPRLSEAGESALTPTLIEASTALPKDNKVKDNNRNKNFKEEIPNEIDLTNPTPSQRRALKKIKPVIYPSFDKKSSYQKFPEKRRGGVDYTHVI